MSRWDVLILVGSFLVGIPISIWMVLSEEEKTFERDAWMAIRQANREYVARRHERDTS